MIKKESSDKDLIERYVSGDKSALQFLVKRWHKIFCEKAYWVLRDKDLSKDVAQDCWVIIIKKLHTLKKAESFKSWALRIVYTLSIDFHKRRARELQKSMQIGDQLNSNSENVGDDSIVKENLLKAIRALPRDKQDIIRLFYVEEYSIKEVSSMLKIPVGTVKSRLFNAREKLKSILKS